MTILFSFDQCEAPPPHVVSEIILNPKKPKCAGIWSIENEIKPSDLYCYLFAKFGPPNGLQNLFRRDDSDNLIHWDWTLFFNNGVIQILGLNLRTELNFIGDWDLAQYSKKQLVSYIKSDFSKYGKAISKIRKELLEDWDIFANPYHQIRKTISQLKSDLDELKLNPEAEKIENPSQFNLSKEYGKEWDRLITKYYRGIGLSIAIRTMIPILAESFVNLIIFILCRPDIKTNERLYNSFVRSNIDVRVQSLHINCVGFETAIDWKNEKCKAYNSVINKRNDLLHGNINLETLKISEIYFNGKVPVFKEYRTMWQQSIGTSLSASGYDEIEDELTKVYEFIEYLYSCLNKEYRNHVRQLTLKRDLGVNKKDKRIGILLPDHIVDFSVQFMKTDS